MEDLKPNGQRAQNAIILLWIVLALEIVSLISGYFQYTVLDAVANGEDISMEEANANDLREQVVGILYLIAYIISAVMFIRWFRRAFYNLQLRVQYLSNSDGWAAGSWFVPIVSLYKPYQIMKELYEETKGALTKNELGPRHDLSTGHLGWWWALWIITNISGQIIFRYSWDAETLEALTFITQMSMIDNILKIPLALLAIKVVKDYSSVEPLLRDVKVEGIPAE